MTQDRCTATREHSGETIACTLLVDHAGSHQSERGHFWSDEPAPTHLLVYPEGDSDRVSVVSVDGDLTDDTSAVVRLPDGSERTVLTLDLVGLDGAPDPHGPSPEEVEVERLVGDGYTTGEAQAIVEHDAGDHEDESDPGCPRCDDTHDPEWSAQYAERGIQRDTLACAYVGSKADAKRLSFDLALQGVEHRVAQDADDPKRWHLAVRGGAAGSPRVWVTSIRGCDPEDVIHCHEPADGGQHPLEVA